jgi:tetratricopeptide (TPR) repeat protein
VPSSDRIDELKKRYDENPRRFFASLANEYRKAGDLEQAITLCQTHLAEQPQNMNGHVVYGQALFEAGRYDEAKGTFEAALALDPENLIALRHLGDIACTNGANDQAREWYTRVLDADPRNDEIIALLASLDEQAKKDAIGAPIASKESMPAREADAGDFKPPQVITPLSTPRVQAETPTIAIEAVNTTRTPVVGVPPVATEPPPDAGLMDLAIDFDSIPDATPATPKAPRPSAELGVDTEFLSFDDVHRGTPIAPMKAVPDETIAPLGDMMVDPFSDMPQDTGASDSLVWEATPAEDDLPPLSDTITPIAEPQEIVAQDDSMDMLFGDSIPAEPAAPFVTETMAELYLAQGFTAEALEVYRQLSAQFPDDEKLRERVRRLARGDRISLSLDVVPAPAAERESSEHTARSYFAALAARRAVQGIGGARSSNGASSNGASAERAPAPQVAAPAPTAAIVDAAHVRSLDELFAGGSISDYDEHIALAFAQVAGAAEMGAAAVKGKPTAQAATELSLDSVFQEAESRATGAVPRQSQTLRFDQFFSTEGTDSGAPPAPQQTAPAGEPGSPAELQQFQSWLSQLKKP